VPLSLIKEKFFSLFYIMKANTRSGGTVHFFTSALDGGELILHSGRFIIGTYPGTHSIGG
jgi:folate-dependent phosphoribosylglycinamide formyltransferase PurN